MKWKKSEITVLVLLGAVGLAAIIALLSILLEYKGGTDTYDFLQGYAFLPEYEFLPDEPEYPLPTGGQSVPENGDVKTDPKTGSETKVSDIPGRVYYGQSPQVDFDSLRKLNNDVVGWIYGPGTKINYPVVQGEDNDYYLTHMFDGKENKCGSIFMDSLNEEDFSNTNSIIHGHHMRNGSMFASLTSYLSQSYYDTHPVLWLTTSEKDYKVELFAGFVTDVNSDVWQIEFASKEEYREWLDKMVENSSFKSDVKPGENDHILTLATCSYEYDNARFVVLGILKEEE